MTKEVYVKLKMIFSVAPGTIAIEILNTIHYILTTIHPLRNLRNLCPCALGNRYLRLISFVPFCGYFLILNFDLSFCPVRVPKEKDFNGVCFLLFNL